MTRLVRGRAVVSDEPTPSPLSTPDKPIVWPQTRTLTLDDGTTVFGCQHCDFVSDRVGAVRPHLGKCTKKPPKPQPPRKATAGPLPFAPDPLIEKVIGALTESRTAVQERDEWERLALDAEQDRDGWRRRAETAEAALRKLFDALGVHP